MGILRILLALAVVVSHSNSRLHGTALSGSIAVQAFFMISGFYIALILHRKYNFPGATKLFYEQRYLRLAPMYWLVTIGTIAASIVTMLIVHHPAGKLEVWSEYGSNMSVGAMAMLVITQVTMLGIDALMFIGFSGQPLSLHFTSDWQLHALPAVRFILVPPAWSLSVELLFYLVAPFLVRRSIRFQLGIVTATFGLRILFACVLGLVEDPWNFRFFPFEAGLFILGSIAYRCLPKAEILVQRYPAIRPALTSILVALIGFYALIPLPGMVRHWGFLALALISIPLLFAATQRDSLDRWVGEMSYPLYLLHQLAFFLAEPLFRRLGGLSYDLASLLVPLAVAAAVYASVERPLEALRARRYHRKSELSEF